MKISSLYEIENFPSKNGAREFVFKYGMCIFRCREYGRHIKLVSIYISLWDCDSIVEQVWDFEQNKFLNCYYDERHERFEDKVFTNFGEENRFIINSNEQVDLILRWAEDEFSVYVNQFSKLFKESPILSNKTTLFEESIEYYKNSTKSHYEFSNRISINKNLLVSPFVFKLLDSLLLSYSVVKIDNSGWGSNPILLYNNPGDEFNIHFKRDSSYELLILLAKALSSFGLRNITLVDDSFDNADIENGIIYIGLASGAADLNMNGCSNLTIDEFLALPLNELNINSLIDKHYSEFTKPKDNSDIHENDYHEDDYDDWQPRQKWDDFIEDAFDGEADATWNID